MLLIVARCKVQYRPHTRETFTMKTHESRTKKTDREKKGEREKERERLKMVISCK